jgi:hypothetical protein
MNIKRIIIIMENRHFQLYSKKLVLKGYQNHNALQVGDSLEREQAIGLLIAMRRENDMWEFNHLDN